MSLTTEMSSHARARTKPEPTDASAPPEDETTLERLGRALGAALSPAVALASRLRGARVFHPDGVVYRGRVEPLESPELSSLGQRLEGRVLVRFSGALLRRGEELPDALGLALRFFDAGHGADDRPRARDQDLLFATLRNVVTAPFASVTTDQHDYLRNTYWAAAPFEVDGVGRVMLRVTPMAAPRSRLGTREEKLERAVESGRVRLRLDARRPFSTSYVPIAILVVERRAIVDQRTLGFSPFQTGRGFVPRGFVHALRRAVYPASQRARLAAG